MPWRTVTQLVVAGDTIIGSLAIVWAFVIAVVGRCPELLAYIIIRRRMECETHTELLYRAEYQTELVCEPGAIDLIPVAQ